MNLAKTAIKTPLTPIDFLSAKTTQKHVDIQVFIKREDLNHPTISGNKWHKLKYNLIAAKEAGKTTLITFGGAYSNHIAATAAAAKEFGFNSIGIIRGDELKNQSDNWSPTLKLAQENGMQLRFVSRAEYRQRHQNSYQQKLLEQFTDGYLIPEGGSNDLAISGFADLMQEINQQCPDWTHLFCAVGTGATLAGLIRYANFGANTARKRQIYGVAVLKQAEYLVPDIENWSGVSMTDHNRSKPDGNLVEWQLLTQYHGGGYGKQTAEAAQNQQLFEQQSGILLDPVYTSKVVAAVQQELLDERCKTAAKIIILHSGGLQAR